MKRLRAVLASLTLLLGAAFAPASHAAPPTDVAQSPRDVPMLVQPQAIQIPALPATDQVRDLGWLKIAYPPSAHERVEPLVRDADDIKAQLTDELGQPVLTEPVEVRVARSPEDMVSLAPPNMVPQYAVAVAIPERRLVILSMRAPFTNEGADLGESLRHELAHVALDDALVGNHVPAWFNEGFAIHASGENALLRVKTLTEATLWKTLIPLADLDKAMPEDPQAAGVAYAEAGDFLRFLLRQSDRARFASVIDRARKGQPFDRALADAYGADMRKLEYEWREQLAQHYTFWPVLLSGSALWVLVIGAMGLGWMKKKRREKQVFARWEREEAMDAARRVAISSALASEPPPPPDDPGMRPSAPGIPKIEHDGSWHTVH
jgi:hypothetical protein